MISTILIILTSLFFPGIIIRVKSLASGRKGPGLLQPVKNILLLLRKGSVFSSSSSYITQIAPVIYISAIFCVVILVPLPGKPALIGFDGDFILLAYLLGLGKFFFIISAMDSGSSFQGMGANREALYSMLVEPAFFILTGTLALLTGHFSLQDLFSGLLYANHLTFIIYIIIIYLFIQISMIENSRMPVDDPKTHLELTMIHEVMVLDYSGFDLALINIGTNLKFAIYGTLIANCIIPSDWSLIYKVVIFFGIQVVFAGFIGVLESFRARKKLVKNPQFIFTLSAVALVAFILCLLIINHMIK